MKYFFILIWATSGWSMPCEENLRRLPEIRQVIQRLEVLQQLEDAGIGIAQVRPIKRELLLYEKRLQHDEPLSSMDLSALESTLHAADSLRMAAVPHPSAPRGSRRDMYDRRFGYGDRD